MNPSSQPLSPPANPNVSAAPSPRPAQLFDLDVSFMDAARWFFRVGLAGCLIGFLFWLFYYLCLAVILGVILEYLHPGHPGKKEQSGRVPAPPAWVATMIPTPIEAYPVTLPKQHVTNSQ